MKVDKVGISLDAALGDDSREAAREAGVGPSSCSAGAAATKLRAGALRDFLDEWEAEHGALTLDELGRAEAELAR